MRMLFVYKSYEWLGIEYLSAALEKAGHKTDLAFEYGLGGTFYFSYFRSKSNHNSILNKIDEFKPDMILFSSTTNLFPWVREVAKEIKNHCNIPIIIGGIHATILPERVLSDNNIDMVCIGEGELAIVELANKMEQGKEYHDTKNIWFKQNNKIIKNSVRPLIGNLDQLPFPNKDLFYKYGCITDRVYVATGRGCPYSCPYCHNHQLKKIYKETGCNYVRRRSVASVIEELEIYKLKYRIKSVHFYDDTFNLNKEWILEFSEKYKEKIGLPFFCLTRANHIDRESVEALKEARCECIGMALESGNSYIRNELLKRNMSDEQIYEAGKIINENKIQLVTFNMFCLPGETPQQMLETAYMNFQLKPHSIFTYTFYPFPGTDLMKISLEQNYIDDKIYEKIIDGEESYTAKSLLNHPYKDIAYNIKIILPFLNRLPRILRSYFLKRWIFKKHSDFLLAIIKILLIPTYCPWEAKARIREQISMFKINSSQKIKKLFK